MSFVVRRCAEALGPRAVQQVIAENAILQRVVHPYIVSLHYSFQDDVNFYLLFEYLGGGDLFHHLQQHGQLTEPSARHVAAEVTLALEYLHSAHTVVYRDLKPENVLLALDGHAVLADFGSARALQSLSRVGARTIVGTPSYMVSPTVCPPVSARRTTTHSHPCCGVGESAF
jgi:serine/threonine protein kinase